MTHGSPRTLYLIGHLSSFFAPPKHWARKEKRARAGERRDREEIIAELSRACQLDSPSRLSRPQRTRVKESKVVHFLYLTFPLSIPEQRRPTSETCPYLNFPFISLNFIFLFGGKITSITLRAQIEKTSVPASRFFPPDFVVQDNHLSRQQRGGQSSTTPACLVTERD